MFLLRLVLSFLCVAEDWGVMPLVGNELPCPGLLVLPVRIILPLVSTSE